MITLEQKIRFSLASSPLKICNATVLGVLAWKGSIQYLVSIDDEEWSSQYGWNPIQLPDSGSSSPVSDYITSRFNYEIVAMIPESSFKNYNACLFIDSSQIALSGVELAISQINEELSS